MAKSLSYPKITVETPTESYRFDAPDAIISSLNGGVTHHLTTGELYNKRKIDKTQFFIPFPAGGAELPTPHSNEQTQGLQVVAQKAKAIERQKLMNARAVESAIREARKLEATAQHEFNMAVLQALHTGLSQEAIETHLTDLHLDYTERVDSVNSLDTEMLYTLDMPNA